MLIERMKESNSLFSSKKKLKEQVEKSKLRALKIKWFKE
jgi:hypothetical protein